MNGIDLNGEWQLTSPQCPDIAVSCSLPGDIHSALLAAEAIPHPYFNDNEKLVQWVGETEWQLSRTITFNADDLKFNRLDWVLNFVDTQVSVFINDKPVTECLQFFVEHRIDVLPHIKVGENRFTLVFHPNAEEAKRRAERLPFPIPWAEGNNQVPHMNLLRKPQCHAGWDWGLCLLTMGIHEPMQLQAIEHVHLQRITTEQNWQGKDRCELVVNVEYEVLSPDVSEVAIDLGFGDQQVRITLTSPSVGLHVYSHRIDVCDPILWYPAGYGDPHLYDLQVTLQSQKIEKKIGLRRLHLDTSVDDIGSKMTFVVNELPIMAKGANWIPLDAMPSLQTPERYRQLLEDAVAANMNMIRVWGGGMYEREIFYQICDELGLLVWQDLMFACALYPSTPEFLAEVEQELMHQIPRLKDHPCIALWCGDNEVIGAINWYPTSRQSREKYVVNYDRLNRHLALLVEKLDPSRRFWASSPCNGELDYGDAWHDDNKGDMHFWDVWHSGKSFDAYYGVKPRFCSEFGYQSWPSLPTVKRFIDEAHWNITAPVFEQHQKNARGNSIIAEMFTRYFRFPTSFEQQLYLSQVQQALAIKTASEYWRVHKDHCRGILFWQLNDCWPVSSWSSIEYTGRWKPLHYHAKRFFAPQLACFLEQENQLTLHWVNDRPYDVDAQLRVEQLNWQGDIEQTWHLEQTLAADTSNALWSLDLSDVERNKVFFRVVGVADGESVENTHVPTLFKSLDLPEPNIRFDVIEEDNATWIELDCDYPALFVHLEIEGEGRFGDSCFTLLPSKITEKKRRVRYLGKKNSKAIQSELTLYHLRKTY